MNTTAPFFNRLKVTASAQWKNALALMLLAYIVFLHFRLNSEIARIEGYVSVHSVQMERAYMRIRELESETEHLRRR